jgi:hypothetical protein
MLHEFRHRVGVAQLRRVNRVVLEPLLRSRFTCLRSSSWMPPTCQRFAAGSKKVTSTYSAAHAALAGQTLKTGQSVCLSAAKSTRCAKKVSTQFGSLFIPPNPCHYHCGLSADAYEITGNLRRSTGRPTRFLNIGRWINLFSYGMFYHTEHHLFPAVPTCRLGILAARLDTAAPIFTTRQSCHGR